MNPVAFIDGGDYTVNVSNSCGYVVSSPATLTVNAAPSLTTPPTSITACVGSPVTFSVCATGTEPLSYQWQKNGEDIAGASLWQLVMNPVAFIDGGDYTVNVSNSCGYVVSSPATLTVNAAPVASFLANPTSGCAPLTVQFNDTSTNNPAMWNWSFGDGTWFNTTDSALRNATKTYSEPGTYIAQLTVSNTCGSDTTVPGAMITVSGLGDALDAPELTWATGGAAKWFCEQVVYMNDNDAAESGDIGNSQSSYLRTTMAGPGTLKFNWKVSSEYNDTLRFSIDGVQKAQIRGEVGWQQKSYLIGDGTHTVEWNYRKNSAISKGSDCGWVDKVELIPRDKTPPGIVTDIHNTTYLQNSITWVWTDPTDTDFDHVMVYLNGVSKGNVTKTIQTYTASGLTAGRTYTIGIKTVDLSGNINENIQTNSATTAPSTTTALITVVYPNGFEQWYRGKTYPIRWTYTGSPGTTVRIELLKGGMVNRVISSGAQIGWNGTGVYNWPVPWTQTTGSDFKIRITSTTNSAYTDTSNRYFIIS